MYNFMWSHLHYGTFGTKIHLMIEFMSLIFMWSLSMSAGKLILPRP